MRTKTRARPAAPLFTVHDLAPDPDHPADCIHQLPRHLATVDGWPRCADCRHELQATRGALPPADPVAVEPAPDPWQPALPLSPADRASGAHLED